MGIHFFIRWFGLDTVLSVVVVQLFLMQLFSVFSWKLLVGLSFVTSFFYMMDRLVDLYFVKVSLNSRHFVYYHRPVSIIISFLFLGGGSFLFWFNISLRVELFVLFFIFLGHMSALYFSFYRYIKPLGVALIFTMVMLLFHDVSLFSVVGGLIFSCTLLNLVIHEWFERRQQIYVILIILLSMALLFLSFLFSPLALFIWMLPVIVNFVLMRYFSSTEYWFEYAELIYAMPFLIAATFMSPTN